MADEKKYTYNSCVAKANKSQYSRGNDCEMPDCFVSGSYLDGIYQEFDKEKAPKGWPDVQPSFKLNMEVVDGNPQWKGTDALTDADKEYPNYPAMASGYNTNSAVMPATEAWPRYEEAGRGDVAGEQVGYVDSGLEVADDDKKDGE